MRTYFEFYCANRINPEIAPCGDCDWCKEIGVHTGPARFPYKVENCPGRVYVQNGERKCSLCNGKCKAVTGE